MDTLHLLAIHILANFLYMWGEKFVWRVDNLTFCCSIDLVLTIPVLISYFWPARLLLAPLSLSLMVTGVRNGYLIYLDSGLGLCMVSSVFPYYLAFALMRDARGLRRGRDVPSEDASEVKNEEEDADKELRNIFEGLRESNQCVDLQYTSCVNV